MQALATLAAVKRIVILAGGACAVMAAILNVILIPVVNPVFDPDWREHDPVKRNGFRERFARASTYAWDVVYTKKGWNRFSNSEYDYRGRVTDGAAALCWVYWSLIFVFGAAVVVWGLLAMAERLFR